MTFEVDWALKVSYFLLRFRAADGTLYIPGQTNSSSSSFMMMFVVW